MVQPRKGQVKAASELLRSEPRDVCDLWSPGDGQLETRIVLRSRRHRLHFRVEVMHFPKHYRVSPCSGVIRAKESVTVTVRLILAGRSGRSRYQHSRGSATWTDLRVHVGRAHGHDELLEDGDTDAVDVSESGASKLRARGGRRKEHSVGRRPATFVKALRLRPLLIPEERCCVCFCDMSVKRHAAGVEGERLFALGCGHVLHNACVAQAVLALYCPCGCMRRGELTCPLCRRPASAAEHALIEADVDFPDEGGEGGDEAASVAGGSTAARSLRALRVVDGGPGGEGGEGGEGEPT
jgi:hypothetical protein